MLLRLLLAGGSVVYGSLRGGVSRRTLRTRYAALAVANVGGESCSARQPMVEGE